MAAIRLLHATDYREPSYQNRVDDVSWHKAEKLLST